MKDITVSKNFNEIKLNNRIFYIRENEFLKKLKNNETKIYNIQYANYNKRDVVIFDCVDDDNCLSSYVIKDTDGIYDLLSLANEYSTDNVWSEYKYAHLEEYNFYAHLKMEEYKFDKKEPKIYSDIESPKDNILYHFGFKVDKLTDILCSDDDCEAFCKITFHNDVNDLKTIIRKYVDLFEPHHLTGSCLTEIVETMPCKERPYKVYIYGVDDSSYTKTFKTLDEVKEIALCLQMFDKIYTQKFIKEYGFVFTN